MTQPRRLTADEQQRILKAQQSSPSFDPYMGYRNSEKPGPDSGTTNVSPSADPVSGRPITWANQGGIDTGTTVGRGNPSERSGGSRIPPPVPGGSVAPSPPQLTGSNLPGSAIRQA